MFQNTKFRTLRLSRRNLEKLRDSGQMTDMEVIGILYADEDVTPDLIEQTISSVKVYGRILATPPVKQALMARDAA